jgi:O-antigen/teichoic acid export membrane protein
VLGFVFWIVAARFYSPSEVGIVSALIAAMMLLAAFSRLGFDMGVIRFLAAEPDKPRMINSCLTITCLASLILSLVFVAGLDFWSPALSFIRTDVPFLISFIIFTVVFALSIMLGSIFVALRRAEFSFFQNTIAGILRVTLPILAVSAGALGLFFSWGIGVCLAITISLLLFLSRLQPRYRPLPRITKSVVNDMVHFSFMNYITGILQVIPLYILPLLVINILGSETTAYFRIAWAISSVLFLTIPTAIATSLFAEGSYNPDKLRNNTIRAAKLMLMLIVPGIAVVFLFGDKILLLFGTAYSENGLRLLQILALSSVPVIFIHLYIVIRMVQMRMKPVILMTALIAGLALGIIYALIPQFGLVGIGIGWTVAQVVIAVLIGAMILMHRQGWLRSVI